MRTIKFRAWITNEKKMLYPPKPPKFNPLGAISNPLTTEFTNHKGGKVYFMQFTGLKDKNEKEIYEGDIVEYNGAYAEDKKPHNLLVEYHNKQGVGHWNSASFVLKEKIKNKDVGRLGDFLCMPDITLEVIGNIYEDYKLLNKEEK